MIYIFDVFDTLEWSHICFALNSIAHQVFEPIPFVLYNHSDHYSPEILNLAQDTFGRSFSAYDSITVENDAVEPTTLADIKYIMSNIGGADRYFLHKADFFLAQGIIELIATTPNIDWINVCKFDLDETWSKSAEAIRLLASKSFNDILALPQVANIETVTPEVDLTAYHAFGYAGHDGTMMAYSEKARQEADLDTFLTLETVQRNQQRLNWIYGDKRFFALHMWHAIPQKRSDNREIVGHRF